MEQVHATRCCCLQCRSSDDAGRTHPYKGRMACLGLCLGLYIHLVRDIARHSSNCLHLSRCFQLFCNTQTLSAPPMQAGDAGGSGAPRQHALLLLRMQLLRMQRNPSPSARPYPLHLNNDRSNETGQTQGLVPLLVGMMLRQPTIY